MITSVPETELMRASEGVTTHHDLLIGQKRGCEDVAEHELVDRHLKQKRAFNSTQTPAEMLDLVVKHGI